MTSKWTQVTGMRSGVLPALLWLGVGCATTLTLQGPNRDPVPEVVKARAFEVVDADGTVLVRLDRNPRGGGRLAINDPAGGVRAAMVTNPRGFGEVLTFNAQGRVLTALVANGKRMGQITTFDGSGREGPLATLGATEDGSGVVEVHHREGRRLLTLGALGDGGVVEVRSPDGRAAVHLIGVKDGGVVKAFDPSGQPLIAIGPGPEGGGQIAGSLPGQGLGLIWPQ